MSFVFKYHSAILFTIMLYGHYNDKWIHLLNSCSDLSAPENLLDSKIFSKPEACLASALLSLCGHHNWKTEKSTLSSHLVLCHETKQNSEYKDDIPTRHPWPRRGRSEGGTWPPHTAHRADTAGTGREMPTCMPIYA